MKPLIITFGPERSFGELLSLHRELEESFHRHQLALIRLEFAQAARLLNDYEALLVAHLADEEEILIPIYAERAEPRRRDEVEIFLSEHRKLLELLAGFRRDLGELPASTDVEHDVIALFDDEAVFKRLVERHDAREEKLLYPALDRVTSEEEKLSLLKRIHGTSSRSLLEHEFAVTAHQ